MAVGGGVGVIGFIPHIPDLDTGVFSEAAHHAQHVVAQCVVSGRVLQHFGTRILYPAGVVDMRFRRPLFAEFWKWIPARIEQDEHHANSMLVRHRKKLVHPWPRPSLFYAFPEFRAIFRARSGLNARRERKVD